MKARAAAPDVALRYVRTEDIDALWPLLKVYLQRAFDKAPTDLDPQQLKALALAGKVRLWVASKGGWPIAAMATGEQPDGAVEVFALSGPKGQSLGWLRPMLGEFEDMAREAGMTLVRFSGRKGWGRVVGYPPVALDPFGRWTFEKVL